MDASRPQSALPPDCVFIRSLSLSTICGGDAWNRRDRPQPVLIDVRIPADLKLAGSEDSLQGSVNYSNISKVIRKAVETGAPWDSLEAMLYSLKERIQEVCGQWVPSELKIVLPKGALMTEGVGIYFDVRKDAMEFLVQRLRVACIIGLNDHERLARQDLLIDLRLRDAGLPLQKNCQGMVADIVEVRALYLPVLLGCCLTFLY